jgi:bla regulator protein blaR1
MNRGIFVRRRKPILGATRIMFLALLSLPSALLVAVLHAQEAPEWQIEAGGTGAFESASVKLSRGPSVPPSVGLDAGEANPPSAGYFRADASLWTYIQFAFKIAPDEERSREILARAPTWLTTDRYSVEAKGPANATKDQMLLMVQSLLAQRFKLAVHFETNESTVFNLILVKAGELGPRLRPHADGPARDGEAEEFPPTCDSFVLLKSGTALRLAGYRNATMEMLAASLAPFVAQDSPVIDKPGLVRRFDFTMQWVPGANARQQDAAAGPFDPAARQAVRDQLGLTLEPARSGVRILVIDRVERPSEN